MKGNRMIQGTIIRVAGPVVDVKFTEGKLPALQEALTVTQNKSSPFGGAGITQR